MADKDKLEAYEWAFKASQIDPDLEEPWLIMAAASDPNESLQYLHKVLERHPDSKHAQKGILWATQKLQEIEKTQNQPSQQDSSVHYEGVNNNKPDEKPKSKLHSKKLLFWILCGCLILFFCLGLPAIAIYVLSAFSAPPAFIQQMGSPYSNVAAIIESINYKTVEEEAAFGITEPIPSQTPGYNRPENYPTLTSKITHAPTPTNPPPVVISPVSPEVYATAYSYTQHFQSPKDGYNAGINEKWIDVNLNEQKLYAIIGDLIIKRFFVSSGVADFPTMTGKFRIYQKVKFDDMEGPGYYLPSVPYVMYFYQAYGLHGTYWHHNFGHPMSHGCINMETSDAEWLYGWAPIGTTVIIHN